MTFTVATHQNEYLPAGASQVHAIVTVTAGEDVGATAAPDRAIVLVVDTSGSMSAPMSKMIAARSAISAAVRALPDGTMFAIVSGDHEAFVVYPPHGDDLVRASTATRAAALAEVALMQPSGGTAISTWLDLTRTLFDGHDDALKLAYLLTDGKNESEPAERLRAAIGRCVGEFQCDARGVGTAWKVDELRQITSALLGEVALVREPSEMETDFLAFLDRALGRSIRDVRLRAWTPKGSEIAYVRQVSPTIEDLTDSGEQEGPLVRSFPTGSWTAGETRDYHVSVEVPPGDVGQEKLAARMGLVLDGEQVSQALVRAVWTEDTGLTTRIDGQVAHYTGQAELAGAIREGLAARREGDEATATIKLGQAVKLAHEGGNEGTVRLLAKVVEVEDPATGTVRLKRRVDELDEMELDTRSTRTVRVTAKDGS